MAGQTSYERATTEQYLTFEIADETYGIEVKSIREILELQRITHVPRTADYLLGVMNVRGRVVPVVDLRLKFGLPLVDRTVESAIIVLEVDGLGSETLIGLLVDSVDEVVEMGSADVEPAPRVGTTVDGQLLSGMGKRDDRFVLLVDTAALFDGDDLEFAARAASEEALAQPADA